MTDLGEPLPPLPEPGYDPDTDDPGASRRRALWVMVVLACLALIVGCLMVLLGGGSGPKQHHINLLPPVHTPSSTAPRATQSGPAAVRSTSPSTGTATSPSLATSTAPAGPPRRGNPCVGSNSCVVGGDGGALAAVNAYRTAHGVPAVPGGVSSNAQICAQDKGSGPTCVPHYAWTALADQDGAQAVRKIADFGSDWLLDQSVKTISVGWAYVGGQYECVLLKAP